MYVAAWTAGPLEHEHLLFPVREQNSSCRVQLPCDKAFPDESFGNSHSYSGGDESSTTSRRQGMQVR